MRPPEPAKFPPNAAERWKTHRLVTSWMRPKVHHYPMYANSRQESPRTVCGKGGIWRLTEESPEALCKECEAKVNSAHYRLLVPEEER